MRGRGEERWDGGVGVAECGEGSHAGLSRTYVAGAFKVMNVGGTIRDAKNDRK